ncbi:MAG: DUF2752 domain-containing protein [Clostridiales bacterium]|jgi:hypothetical protein|nr:DUF2752 domain-containing protein [Clostridiales bacterium]
MALILAAIGLYYYTALRFFGYVCLSEIVLGLPCPACGLTRAGWLFLRGEFWKSWNMNPFLGFAAIYFALAALARNKSRRLAKYRDIYLICIVFASFIVFAFRVHSSFGTEPLVLNPNSLLFRLLRIGKSVLDGNRTTASN